MALSWNEIKSRAIQFTREWEGETRERAEKDSFWNDFFHVFGISRRRVATFEQNIKKLNNNQGFIDLFWPGHLIIEHKSQGKDLEKAFQQALEYIPNMKEHELPRYILVCDFTNFILHDLEENERVEFTLDKFHENIQYFGFIAGYKRKTYASEDPVNIEAAERMGRLHDSLRETGYEGHDLEVYLVRLLFCLFAEDTGIFEKGLFQEYIETHTKEDGSDLAMHLAQIFEVLNEPTEKRVKNLDESLKVFPYVNGQLFEERLKFAHFDSKMREMLLQACALDWSKISPAIFGSMFQSVMNPEERRNLGAHYTSEKNIFKLIEPLFLDELRAELDKCGSSTKKLQQFHQKLAKLTFLDPACGCGNFLIITYRELRLLELEVLKKLQKKDQLVTDISSLVQVNVDQFFGIEYDEFPARIAEVAMWLTDHQMNVRVSEELGNYFTRLPLKKAAKIVHGNALRTPWESLIAPENLSFIMGNPPFYGSKLQSKEQRGDLAAAFGKDVKGAKVMDYVSAWYILAAKYIQNTAIRVAFVSTNSITQGEQVGILWDEMLRKYNVKIQFAHRTFKWSNEARGNAAVYCVILGFGLETPAQKWLFDYEHVKSEPKRSAAKNINPYLVDAPDLVVSKRTVPLADVPKIKFGNQPNDGGGFLFTDEEKNKFLEDEPDAKKFIRPFLGSREFIRGIKRWCLWLKGVAPSEFAKLAKVRERIEIVRKHRLASSRPATVDLAETPTLFGFISHNDKPYIIIPSVSSERRKYIPIGFIEPSTIASNLCLIIPGAEIFHFGILTSKMHMAWVSYTCGRLKSDYRYSNKVVYNNFPFPRDVSAAQKKKVETAAQGVLDARALFPESSLAELYDPLTMPPELLKAHQKLDKAVDNCYRPQPFPQERNRIEFLFELYEAYTAPLLQEEKKAEKRKKRQGR